MCHFECSLSKQIRYDSIILDQPPCVNAKWNWLECALVFCFKTIFTCIQCVYLSRWSKLGITVSPAKTIHDNSMVVHDNVCPPLLIHHCILQPVMEPDLPKTAGVVTPGAIWRYFRQTCGISPFGPMYPSRPDPSRRTRRRMDGQRSQQGGEGVSRFRGCRWLKRKETVSKWLPQRNHIVHYILRNQEASSPNSSIFVGSWA